MSERFNETADNIKLNQAVAKMRELKNGTVVPIPLKYLDRSENIRKEIDTKSCEFDQLKKSIKEVGLLQYPVVTIVSDKILCVSGHRRLAAMEELGEEKVSCVVNHFDTLDQKDLAQIIENTARKNLNPFDLADQLLKLKERGFSQVKLQDLVGKNRQVVGRYQKLAMWPENLRSKVQLNPDKINIKTLMTLASVNDFAELESKIDEILGIKPIREGATSPVAKRYPLSDRKFSKFCNEKKFRDEQIAFLKESLQELKLLQID